ncbi:hypothetical protein HYC85_001195 [Camellia sinensis]|uniref:MHD domain-containing protein n=1 Tax=Camellia sinensis TaxID=4442 RepID=A0A7J7I656_CAMSI|nr:hypothetical protein HYC85_001195 [Camellia sinensis]
MVDGLVTEGSPSPKGSSHIVKHLLLERDLLTLMDIVKRNGGKNQSSASEIVLGMSPRASIGVQSEVPTPSSFVEAMSGLCSEIRDLAQQQKLCFGGEVVPSLAVVHSQIELPVPADATNPNVRTSLGSASYAPEKDALIWEIKSFPGGKEYMPRAEYTLPSITSEDAAYERKAPIRVKFEIPYFAVSGIQVRYLKIIEKSGYQALPRARYITMAGDYQMVRDVNEGDVSLLLALDKQYFYIDNNTALETLYRLNISGKELSVNQDTGMYWRWDPNDRYIYGAAFGLSPHLDVPIRYTNDTPNYTAPATVYTTARTVGKDPHINLQYNLTWIFAVDSGFWYLARLHFL